jgi:hypothetical protein
MRRCGFLVLGSLLACGEDPPSSQDSSSSGGDGSTSTSSGADGSSTGAPGSSSSGGADSSGSSSGGTTGELPDYSDSPCWGMPATTLVYDGQTHQTVEVPATCRAEGDRAFVIVADTLWENGIDQAAVNGFMHRYELFTPDGAFDPSQGVIRNDEAVFGSLDAAQLPGGKVSIFVVDTNGGGDGYLCGWCDYPQLHLDGTVLSPLDGDDALSIAAHESYHIIHYGYDADEEPWVDESLAQAAMTANGFFTDDEWLDDFRLDPDQDWGPGGVDFGSFNYGAGLVWGSYLYERGGAALGFYARESERVPIRALRFADELPPAERTPLEVLRTDGATFARLVEARRNRRDGWYVQPAGHIDLCSVPLPVREAIGAADRDREVAAIARLVLGDPHLEEGDDVLEQPLDARLRLQPAHHLGVAAGEGAQRGVPVRVRQRARVEHEVGVARQAVLEAKGDECDRQAPGGAARRAARPPRAGRARPSARCRPRGRRR